MNTLVMCDSCGLSEDVSVFRGRYFVDIDWTMCNGCDDWEHTGPPSRIMWNYFT